MGQIMLINVILAAIFLLKTGEAIKCSMCDSSRSGYSCLANPPSAQRCDGFLYCITVAQYRQNGALESLKRSCSPFSLPDSCLPGTDRSTGKAIQVCYSTCSKDGCNESTSLHHVLDLLRRRK